MQRKDFGLVVALGLFVFLAVASEKKILIAEGFAVTREELNVGRRVYDTFCRSCHEEGVGGAPQTGAEEAWRHRTRQGMTLLIAHAIEGFQGQTGWMPPMGGAAGATAEEVALAVAYMVGRSEQRVPDGFERLQGSGKPSPH